MMTLLAIRPQVTSPYLLHGLLERRAGVGGPELDSLLPLERHRVDGEDMAGPGKLGALYGIDPDAPDADDSHVLARPDICGVDRRTPPGDNAAAEQAGLVEGDLRIDLDAAGLVDDRALRECPEKAHQPEVGSAGVVAGGLIEDLPARRQPRPQVAEVLVSCCARRAAPAGRYEPEHDVVTRDQPVDPAADLFHHACPFVATHHGQGKRQVAGDEVLIGVAQPGAGQPNQHLPLRGGSRSISSTLQSLPTSHRIAA